MSTDTPATAIEVTATHPLDDAIVELLAARAIADLLYVSSADLSSPAFEELDAGSLCSMFHTILQKLDRARKLVDEVPRRHA